MTFPIVKAGVSLRISSHPTQSQSQRPAQAEPVMDGGDSKAHLPPYARYRIVNKIIDTLKRHLPVSRPEGLRELRKIAERFEEKIYSAATSECDYLRKISLKMLAMETKCFNAATNSLLSNSAAHIEKSTNGKKSPALKESHRSSMNMLKRHLPISGPEGLHELRKIAERFEEKIYCAATSEKISLKTLAMETICFNAATDSLPSNSTAHRKKSSNDTKSPARKESHRSRI